MKTKEFISLLKAHPSKKVVFEYQENKFVPETYHITEIKNSHVTSVDCGGFMHDFNETIVQLWVNEGEAFKEDFTAEKALKIIDIVNSKYTINTEADVFFEYGYIDIPTSSYKVKKVHIRKDEILVKLYVPATVCKPSEAGMSICC